MSLPLNSVICMKLVAGAVAEDIRVARSAVRNTMRVVVAANKEDILALPVRRGATPEGLGDHLHGATIKRHAVHPWVTVDLSIDVRREQHARRPD